MKEHDYDDTVNHTRSTTSSRLLLAILFSLLTVVAWQSVDAGDLLVAPKGIGPDDMIPNGISFDIANPKYRQFKSGDDILEYTLEGGEITIDWVSGKGASSIMKSILDADGAGVTCISGYVTDKLGGASDAALQRLGNQMAGQLGGGWKATIELIEGRRYLVFTK